MFKGGGEKIECKDCQVVFIFTKQQKASSDRFGNEKPIRCKECRDAKKARNNGDRSVRSAAQIDEYKKATQPILEKNRQGKCF